MLNFNFLWRMHRLAREVFAYVPYTRDDFEKKREELEDWVKMNRDVRTEIRGVVQSVEHLNLTQEVVGSIPTPPFQIFQRFFLKIF